jgi:hypothetical protein
VLKEIDRLSISPINEPVSEIYSQLNFLATSHTQIVFISDFRKGFLEELTINPNPITHHYWLPVPALHSENVSVDSAWF